MSGDYVAGELVINFGCSGEGSFSVGTGVE